MNRSGKHTNGKPMDPVVDPRPLFQTETYLEIVIEDEMLPKPHRMLRADEYRRTHRDPLPGEVAKCVMP